jgi:hypothetical protein
VIEKQDRKIEQIHLSLIGAIEAYCKYTGSKDMDKSFYILLTVGAHPPNL